MTELKQLVDSIAYRPHDRFELEYDLDHDYMRLVITRKVPDSRDPEAMVVLNFHNTLPTQMEGWTEDRAKDWIRECIMNLERHECDEYLAFDGVKPYHPHGETHAIAD